MKTRNLSDFPSLSFAVNAMSITWSTRLSGSIYKAFRLFPMNQYDYLAYMHVIW